MLDFENQFAAPVRIPLKNRIHYEPELGIFPLLAAAVPMVTSLAGSLLSRKDKSGSSPPEAVQAQGVLDLLTKAMTGEDGQPATSLKDVVKNVVSTVPSPVVGQVKKAINEMKNAEKATAQSRSNLVNAVDAKFGPQIGALLAGLKAQQLQTQATYEHNTIKTQEDFRKSTATNLENIAKRLLTIEAALGNSAVVRGQNRIAVLGGHILR